MLKISVSGSNLIRKDVLSFYYLYRLLACGAIVHTEQVCMAIMAIHAGGAFQHGSLVKLMGKR